MAHETIISISFALKSNNHKVFQVNYHKLGGNGAPYFSTSAGVMNRPRTDYVRVGQCQKSVLSRKDSELLAFYNKWDAYHLLPLTLEQIDKLMHDIDELKKVYDYVCIKYGNADISFQKEVWLQRKNRNMLDSYIPITKGFSYEIH